MILQSVPTRPESSFGRRRPGRLACILGMLAPNQTVSVEELACSLDVSAATVRRDLAVLEAHQLVTRVRGGVRYQPRGAELPVRYRDSQFLMRKRSIAMAAVSLLPRSTHTVALTGGTTTRQIAKLLTGRSQLTVVTSALNIALELGRLPGIKVIVPGGFVRWQTHELVGPATERTLREMDIETAFVGVDGISVLGGITTHDEVEALTNAAMISRAARVVVVADSSKIGRVTLAQIGNLSQVDVLVTDDSADATEVAALSAAGIRVIVAIPSWGGQSAI
ncbi:MAG: DeoR/GlpR family DNA-binding transcription regulator [Actinomycetes bacterium]